MNVRQIQARELLRMQSKIRTIMSEHTGQPIEKIARDFDRDMYMDSYQAVEYGIIDEIVATTRSLPSTEQSPNGLDSLVKAESLK